MTEPPRLELVDEDDDDEHPPPTHAQREWIREAVRAELAAQMAPILAAWDARSLDMLAVLGEAGDAKRQVRSAAMTIKVAGWLGVTVLAISGVALWFVLERERDDRRAFREQEQVRRLEAAQLIIAAGHEDVRKIDTLMREHACPR
jgi:hypothetical protein